MAKARAKASAASASASAGSVTVPDDTKVKMVQRHPQFVEPDVEAAQAASDENRFNGQNPYAPGTARAAAWDHLKANTK